MSAELVAQNWTGTDRLPLTKSDLESLKEKRQVIKDFVKSSLVLNVDFGKIPGCGDQLNLLQPGAQKIALLFGLGSRIEYVDKDIDHNGNFAIYTYKCIVYHLKTGTDIAEVIGTANSKEKKFATRTVWIENELGAKVKEKEDTPIYDILNTLSKMAQKRAFVGAIIKATAASDYFTQDLDDADDKTQNGLKPEIKAMPGKLNFTVSGETKPHKDTLREAGGKWNLNAKVWDFKNSSEEVKKQISILEGLIIS